MIPFLWGEKIEKNPPLRYAGEVAVERGSDCVVESDVREAQKRLESDKIVETIKTLPYHQKLTLYVIASNDAKEIGDYKNDLADMAAEKLLRKCSTSWEAYQYLRDRVHEAWLPNSARQQLRQIIKRIQVQIHQSREYGYV